MKNKLRKTYNFKKICEKRGYELIIASGCEFDICSFPCDFFIENDRVIMRFKEDTRHDCPDYVTITLTEEHFEKKDEEWISYIESVKKDTADKKVIDFHKQKEFEYASKRKQFEILKRELGE
jgi:hypothetical protein